MSLAILPGTTLAQIAAVATSFRLHSGAAPPTTYANSVSSTIAKKLFAAGSFFTFVPATGTLSAPAFSGSLSVTTPQRVVGNRPIAGTDADRGYRK